MSKPILPKRQIPFYIPGCQTDIHLILGFPKLLSFGYPPVDLRSYTSDDVAIRIHWGNFICGKASSQKKALDAHLYQFLYNRL